MENAPYKIQEVSRRLELPLSTIRFWEVEFADILRPRRTQGGQRRYSDKDIELLNLIKELLHQKNRTIEQAKRLIRSGNEDIEEIHWERKSILLTGGSGAFGSNFCRYMLGRHNPQVIRIFSRNGSRQHDLQKIYGDEKLRYFLGDIRESDRLKRAMEGVDIVIHAADLKQIPLCEFNPFEAVKTNIHGAQNVIDAAIDAGVKKVIALSSEMAVNPLNIYGATKLCAEKIFIYGNAYSGPRGTRFSCIRFCSAAAGPDGWMRLLDTAAEPGKIRLPHAGMTRFWSTFDRISGSLLKALCCMTGGEIFVPKMPSMKLRDLAEAISPESEIAETGLKPGERMHDQLITGEEGGTTVLNEGMFRIAPHPDWLEGPQWKGLDRVEAGFSYSSNANDEWIGTDELKAEIELLRGKEGH
jgi:UDP-N-acetylglucosamine 4,6-dehydratase